LNGASVKQAIADSEAAGIELVSTPGTQGTMIEA